MKQGEVLMKERERQKISVDEMAATLGLGAEAYRDIEAGSSAAETWGPRIRELAVALEAHTSRLFAASGKAADTRPGQAGERIRQARERCGKTADTVAADLGITAEEYQAIEAGTTDIETWGPLFLRFAEAIEQPVFNLFHPFGLPFERLTLEDYR